MPLTRDEALRLACDALVAAGYDRDAEHLRATGDPRDALCALADPRESDDPLTAAALDALCALWLAQRGATVADLPGPPPPPPPPPEDPPPPPPLTIGDRVRWSLTALDIVAVSGSALGPSLADRGRVADVRRVDGLGFDVGVIWDDRPEGEQGVAYTVATNLSPA